MWSLQGADGHRSTPDETTVGERSWALSDRGNQTVVIPWFRASVPSSVRIANMDVDELKAHSTKPPLWRMSRSLEIKLKWFTQVPAEDGLPCDLRLADSTQSELEPFHSTIDHRYHWQPRIRDPFLNNRFHSRHR